MTQSDLDTIIAAQDALKGYAVTHLPELTPIHFAIDAEGNFTDPRANKLFDDWCDGDAQKSMSEFFDFINV